MDYGTRPEQDEVDTIVDETPFSAQHTDLLTLSDLSRKKTRDLLIKAEQAADKGEIDQSSMYVMIAREWNELP